MQVRVWELNRGYGNQGITAIAKAQINHDAPVLCTDFSADGTAVFSGGASKQARALRVGQMSSPLLGAINNTLWGRYYQYL